MQQQQQRQGVFTAANIWTRHDKDDNDNDDDDDGRLDGSTVSAL